MVGLKRFVQTKNVCCLLAHLVGQQRLPWNSNVKYQTCIINSTELSQSQPWSDLLLPLFPQTFFIYAGEGVFLEVMVEH